MTTISFGSTLLPLEEQIQDAIGSGYPSQATYAQAIAQAYRQLHISCETAVYDEAGNCVRCGESGRCPGWHPRTFRRRPLSDEELRAVRHHAQENLRWLKFEHALLAELQDGHILYETIGPHTTGWSLTMPDPPFIFTSMTAHSLARHLMVRHREFGTQLRSGLPNTPYLRHHHAEHDAILLLI
jgi:hypothetical protein